MLGCLSTTKWYIFAALFALLAAVVPTSAAKTIHVPADQPTIQAGINAAVNGDTVLVAAGTYTENINFNGKAITVTSASGANATIIDGGQTAATVTFATNEARTSILSGFTIRNGYYYYGNGVTYSYASPSILSNIITSNSSPGCYYGGALGGFGGNPLIQGNIITGNGCQNESAIYSQSGGMQVIGNAISGNGGGIYLNYATSPVTIQGNTITENNGYGVNFSVNDNTGLTVIQNVIADNQGTGLFATGPVIVAINNTITNNFPTNNYNNEASEIWIQTVNNQTTVENNLVVATGDASAFSCDTYDPNNPPVFDHNDIFSANWFSYSNACPDTTGSNGNISADPSFAALLSDNVHLQAGSAAIDVGNNSAPQLPATDFDGDARIINSTVDIGADEYSSKTTLTLSSYDVRFTGQNVGTTSGAQMVTLTNHGTTAVALNLIGTGAEFPQTNACGASLAPGASCNMSVKFSPTGSGSRVAVLAIMTGATTNPIVAVLSGLGLQSAVSLNPQYLSFWNQAEGTSVTQTSTLTNSGKAPLTISSIGLSGATDFSQTNNCPVAPSALAIGGTCTLNITWKPAIAGYENATLTITDNASPSTQNLNMSGSSYSNGVPILTPSTLTFPATLIGSTSAAQVVTLKNTGTGPLGNVSVGSYYDFPNTNNCPTVLAVGASCTINVSFAPSQVGTETGNLNVSGDGVGGASVSLTGQGQAPVPALTSLSPASIAAGSANTNVTIVGTGFFGGSQVLINGVPVYTYNNGNNQLTFTVPFDTLANPGTAQITVYNPSPGGGTSSALTLSIYAIANYAVQSVPYTYQKITGKNLRLNGSSSGQVTSPFAIQFGGGSFTTLTVSSGGTISFSGYAGFYNYQLPQNQTASIVAPFWMPLEPFGRQTDNNVFWQVLGKAPNRELVVEWRDIPAYFAYSATETVKFQVIFYEGSSKILFNYADTVFGGTAAAYDNGAGATVGVQIDSGTANQYSYNTPSLSSGTSLEWYPGEPSATVSSSTLNFGWNQIGTQSVPQKVTLTNGSLLPLAVSSITTNDADFTPTNNCGTTLAAGSSCIITVTFDPSSPTAETATLSINDNALGGPQSVTLNGIGAVEPIVVFPVQLRFGTQNVGSNTTLPVTLANAMNAAMTIQSIAASPNVFTETNNCGTSLAVGASCTVDVTFTPVGTGLTNGTLSFGLNKQPASVMVNMSGMGQ